MDNKTTKWYGIRKPESGEYGSFDEIKEHIVPALVSEYSYWIDDGPSLKWNNLNIIFLIVPQEGFSAKWRTLYTNEMYERFHVAEQELLDIALANLPDASAKELPFGGELIVCSGEMDELLCGPIYGAAVLLQTDVFASLAEKLGDDLLIRPFSVDFVNVVKASDPYVISNKSYEYLLSNNAMFISNEGYLSDDCYRYNRDSGTITVAKPFTQEEQASMLVEHLLNRHLNDVCCIGAQKGADVVKDALTDIIMGFLQKDDFDEAFWFSHYTSESVIVAKLGEILTDIAGAPKEESPVFELGTIYEAQKADTLFVFSSLLLEHEDEDKFLGSLCKQVKEAYYACSDPIDGVKLLHVTSSRIEPTPLNCHNFYDAYLYYKKNKEVTVSYKGTKTTFRHSDYVEGRWS